MSEHDLERPADDADEPSQPAKNAHGIIAVSRSDEASKNLYGISGVVAAANNANVQGTVLVIAVSNDANFSGTSGAIVVGGNATVESGFIGLLVADSATLGEDARVLLGLPQAAALGASLGAVFALLTWLLRRASVR